VFERFTEAARGVVIAAQEESRAMRHGYIGTEHLLLGLLQGAGVAAHALAGLGVQPEAIREDVLRLVGRGAEPVSGQMPFTPRALTAMEDALREGLALGDGVVGTEHLLLGLNRGEGLGVRLLHETAGDAGAIRAAVLARLRQGPTAGVDWPAVLTAAAPAGAASVRVTLADGERFLLESFEPVDVEGLLCLAAYLEREEEMIAVEGAEARAPRLVILRPEGLARAEVLPLAPGRPFRGLRRATG
jgi:ATP-dependent Clp protease ATP-binding subunit ClpC